MLFKTWCYWALNRLQYIVNITFICIGKPKHECDYLYHDTRSIAGFWSRTRTTSEVSLCICLGHTVSVGEYTKVPEHLPASPPYSDASASGTWGRVSLNVDFFLRTQSSHMGRAVSLTIRFLCCSLALSFSGRRTSICSSRL